MGIKQTKERELKGEEDIPRNEIHGDTKLPKPQGNVVSQEKQAKPRDDQKKRQIQKVKKIDPRIVTLLESFKTLHNERREFFKQIFPGLDKDFEELFKKLGDKPSKADQDKFQVLQRSLSVGSTHNPRLERFKVKTFDPDEPQDHKPPQGDTTKSNVVKK